MEIVDFDSMDFYEFEHGKIIDLLKGVKAFRRQDISNKKYSFVTLMYFDSRFPKKLKADLGLAGTSGEDDQDDKFESAKSHPQTYDTIKIFSTSHFSDYDNWVLDDFMKKHTSQYFIYTKNMEDYKNRTGKTLIDQYFLLPAARKGERPTRDELLVEFITIKKDFFDAWKRNENQAVRSGNFKKSKAAQKEICATALELFREGRPKQLILYLQNEIFGALTSAENEDYMNLMSGN